MVFSVVVTRKCVGPPAAARARRPVTSRQRGRSEAENPPGWPVEHARHPGRHRRTGRALAATGRVGRSVCRASRRYGEIRRSVAPGLANAACLGHNGSLWKPGGKFMVSGRGLSGCLR